MSERIPCSEYDVVTNTQPYYEDLVKQDEDESETEEDEVEDEC